MTYPLWKPSNERIAQANLTAFLAHVGIGDFNNLHDWSIKDQGGFTRRFGIFLA